MASDITGGVQAMEAEAAQVLEEAKSKAADIVQKAREEARKMATDELPVGDVKTESAALVDKATKSAATAKIDGYADQIVSIVIGEKTA
jgi:vacuolar-type H+-ATPase subunit H